MKIRNSKSITNVFICLCLLFGATSCMKPAAPTFKKMSDVKVGSLTAQEVSITGKANFYNPNGFRVKIKQMYVNVSVNGKTLASIEQSKKTVIRRKRDFAIPLELSVAPKEALKAIAAAGLKTALTQSVELSYEGFLVIKAFFIPIRVPLSEKMKVGI